ncbi:MULTISPECIES: MarR family transcriptional regulator [unclassified Curtobacterium]|uniref:MarR family transcriptional regulator n=1 Tax=unclassified Curtobacterium TaxID=257496 RepID=UPI0021ACCACB|nr:MULTISPECIES: MarR family transcriptional regulator [unclassified Curtobacterium]WIB64540.1 MarR family transcriptional regulator [Curtobacterium sp. MCBD17_040]WIB68381.1 MarR family transcriptional regulator [Curtobacterium sp. MCBD17_035]
MENAPLASIRQLDAYFALIEVSSLLRHSIEQQLRDAGKLSSVQFQLLATLGDRSSGSARMTDLADGVVSSRSGLTYQAPGAVLGKVRARAQEPAAIRQRSRHPPRFLSDRDSRVSAIGDADRAVRTTAGMPGNSEPLRTPRASGGPAR